MIMTRSKKCNSSRNFWRVIDLIINLSEGLQHEIRKPVRLKNHLISSIFLENHPNSISWRKSKKIFCILFWIDKTLKYSVVIVRQTRDQVMWSVCVCYIELYSLSHRSKSKLLCAIYLSIAWYCKIEHSWSRLTLLTFLFNVQNKKKKKIY